LPRTLSDAEIDSFRERICDVAEEMFARHGPDGVTLRELAGTLGVSSMTPYRYFKDKDAILAAVRARAFLRFAAAMEAADSARREGNWRLAGDAYFDFALGHRAAYRLMFDTYQPTFESYPDLVAAIERARATMGGWLRELAAKREFLGDVDLWAHAIWSVMHGSVMLELAGRLHEPLDARAIARPALVALLKEMGIWKSP
jgi:AcrR family transcriptional regulator